LQENGQKKPLYMANPVIISASTETETYNEGSLSFPGISAPVTRPTEITVEYLDYNNNPQTLIATGFLATCIQHEIDYLYGKTFLSYLSPVKRDMLLRKMQKYKKQGHVPHEHSEYCNH
jgi:peptide deformylase